MDTLVTNEPDVLKACQEIKVNKSSAIEHLSSTVLKDSFIGFIPQLTHLINLSFDKATFPDSWKKATIIPLQKPGDKANVTNLRPIALLPLPGKIIECIVHTQVSNYLEEGKLINPSQNGFRKNQSTIATVADITDDILLGINKSKYTIAAYIDYSNDFRYSRSHHTH